MDFSQSLRWQERHEVTKILVKIETILVMTFLPPIECTT